MKNPRLASFNPLATLVCLATLLVWSTGPIFIKYLTGYLDMWSQNFLRYLAACLFWLPFLMTRFKKDLHNTKVWKLAVLPAAANIIMQSLWAAAFYYIEPAFIVLLSKTSIIWIAVFSLVCFDDERPLLGSRNFWLALVLSVVGLAGVLMSKEGFAQRYTAIGIVITLLCAAMWGLYTVFVKAAFKNTDSRVAFSVISVYTVAGLGLLTLLFGRPQDALDMPPWPWACVVISGVLAIGLGHVLYYSSIRRIGATIPSLILLSQPFTVLIISYFVFGESLNLPQWLFGILLLTGAASAIHAQKHLKQKTPNLR